MIKLELNKRKFGYFLYRKVRKIRAVQCLTGGLV
jgi:hypothetical protein